MRQKKVILMIAGLGAMMSVLAGSTEPVALKVDFEYSPPEWQTATCLPDDPYKTLVDKSGKLLYRYIPHFNHAERDVAKGEFGVVVGVQVVDDAVWQNQALHSPRVPIVTTRKSAPGLDITEESFAVTSGAEGRQDLILVRVTNTGKEARELNPCLIINTAFIPIERKEQFIVIDEQVRPKGAPARPRPGERKDRVACSLKIVGALEGGKYPLEALTVPAGKSAEFVVQYTTKNTNTTEAMTVQQAQAYRKEAVEYWEKKSGLPFDRIHVPDAGIQALIDSSIRNIWQAREIHKGLPAFQVGPTCYRGLWIVDGAFLLEAAALVGAGDQARNGVDYVLRRQRADGSIKVMENNFSKENGIVLWTCARHAQLMQDKAWLESIWPKLTRIAEYIKTLRAETLKTETPLDDGLVPPGFPDGGLGGVHPEYTNPYWNMIGLRSFIESARWLGKKGEAARWQVEYDAFMAAFRKAAERDLKKDQAGNLYLPTLMNGSCSPQRGQWAFCHAVYPGQIFAKDDVLVAENTAMLAATEKEGMVYGTGWDEKGIWNYFASFYGHALLWQGNGRKAAGALYAFANHAAPLLIWREEQSLQGDPFKKVGDMPHNWASAEFIRLTVHILALDRGNELHLFEGLPVEWTKPGMKTSLNGVATPFGPLTMGLAVSEDGRTAKLNIEPLTGGSCEKIVVHLSGWSKAEAGKTLDLKPGKSNAVDIAL